MKIERIELNIIMNTKRRNNTSSRVEMKEHNLTLRNKKEVQAFEDMIEEHFLEKDMFNSLVEEHFLEEDMFNSLVEEHFLEEDMFNSLIESHFLEEDIKDSIIEEQAFEAEMFNSLVEESILENAFEAEMFNSLVEERIQEYADLCDAIEYPEEDDCDYDYDYDYDPYENEIAIDLVANVQQFEYGDSEDSSCCFEMGYYNDENSAGIFGAYEDMYNPEFVPSFKHINNF